MSQNIISLREVTDNDMELVLAWRNSPPVYQGFYEQGYGSKGTISWTEHYLWWKSRFNWKRFITQVNDGMITRDVGCVNFSGLDNWNPEVGIFIGEVSLWGRGVGKKALSLALDWLKENGYTAVHTTILKYNMRSIKLFESIGFKKIGEGREGEFAFERKPL